MFASRREGITWFCIDYQKLNTVTVWDSNPLPRIYRCIDSLQDAKMFSALEANNGYRQIEMDKADREKTPFTSHHVLQQFTRMPFGLKNALATSQRIIGIIILLVVRKFSLVYLDDIVPFSVVPAVQIAHTKNCITFLKIDGVPLTLKQYTFFTNRTVYLCLVIWPDWL